ncbi:MAG: hypothetical protein WKF41_06800 [Gaiellaceae bacterium]
MSFTTEPDLFSLLEELLRERREELAALVSVCDALAELHGVALPLQASLTGPLRLEHLEAAAEGEEQRARLVVLLRRGTGVDLDDEDLQHNEEETWRAAAA